MIGGGLGGFAPGEWTDDTAMTVAIAEVTADRRRPAHPGRPRRRRPGVRPLVRLASQGHRHPDQAGTVGPGHDAAAMQATAAALPGRTGGNGRLMRTAPVALAYLHDPAARAEAAAAVSGLTHADPRAAEACQIWCQLIASDRAGRRDRPRMDVPGPTSAADAEAYWRPLKEAAETGKPADFANNGWVVHALQTAWWAITHATATDARQLAEGSSSPSGPAATPTPPPPSPAPCSAPAGAPPPSRPRWRRVLHGWPGLREPT